MGRFYPNNIAASPGLFYSLRNRVDPFLRLIVHATLGPLNPADGRGHLICPIYTAGRILLAVLVNGAAVDVAMIVCFIQIV